MYFLGLMICQCYHYVDYMEFSSFDRIFTAIYAIYVILYAKHHTHRLNTTHIPYKSTVHSITSYTHLYV